MTLKTYFIISILLAVIVFTAVFSCYKRIDATEQGIKVYTYQQDSATGQPVVEHVSGAVWYNPITQDVFAVSNEMQRMIKTFKVSTNDGMMMDLTISLLWKHQPRGAAENYIKYTIPPSKINTVVVETLVSEVVSQVAGRMSGNGIYSQRDSVERQIRKNLTPLLLQDKIHVERIVLDGSIGLPENLQSSIDAKIKADEEALKLKAQEAKVRQQARNDSIAAQGRLVVAKLDAEANEARQKSLTNEVLISDFLKKWDGNLGNGNGVNPLNLLMNVQK